VCASGRFGRLVPVGCAPASSSISRPGNAADCCGSDRSRGLFRCGCGARDRARRHGGQICIWLILTGRSRKGAFYASHPELIARIDRFIAAHRDKADTFSPGSLNRFVCAVVGFGGVRNRHQANSASRRAHCNELLISVTPCLERVATPMTGPFMPVRRSQHRASDDCDMQGMTTNHG
jgi:hypothetical protein